MAFITASFLRPAVPTVTAVLLAFCATTVAGPADYEPVPVGGDHAAEERAAVQSFLNRKLWLWQKRLRLQDWSLKVRLARSNDLRPKTLGNVNWDRREKSATISVLDPTDYKLAGDAMRDDMEMTIVHELVHLHLSGLPRNEATKSAEEQAVVMLTDALVKLDRRRDEQPDLEPGPDTQRARNETASGH
jgi:hypothetical protein